MKIKIVLVVLLIAVSGIFLFNSCSVDIPKGATAIQQFDSEKYLGKWYEIARFDYRFEKDLNNVTATYSKNANGSIKVENRGYHVVKKEWKQATGEAKFVNEPTEARLKVSFFKPFWAGYNVIDLVDYKYALVAGNNTDYLWILSRETTIPNDVKQRFLEKSKQLNFPVEQLIWVEHQQK